MHLCTFLLCSHTYYIYIYNVHVYIYIYACVYIYVCVCVCVCVCMYFSSVCLYVNLWAVARGLSDSSVHGILQARILELVAIPHPGIKATSFASPALGGKFFTTGATWIAPYVHTYICL